MLEKVWKNVVGEDLPYRMVGNTIEAEIPLGCPLWVTDLGRAFDRIEEALHKKLDIRVEVTSEHLLLFKVSERVVEVEVSDEDREIALKAIAEAMEEVEVPKKRTRSKKSEV